MHISGLERTTHPSARPPLVRCQGLPPTELPVKSPPEMPGDAPDETPVEQPPEAPDRPLPESEPSRPAEIPDVPPGSESRGTGWLPWGGRPALAAEASLPFLQVDGRQ
jgi:hypothetical protein